MVIRRKYLVGALLAVLLWAGCALGLLGMFESRMVMAGLAPYTKDTIRLPTSRLCSTSTGAGEYLGPILDILAEKKARRLSSRRALGPKPTHR